MHVSLLIADYADLADGKLGVLGGGIRYLTPHSGTPISVVAFIDATTEQSGKKFDIALRVMTTGGEPVGETRPDGSAFRYEIADSLTIPEGQGAEDGIDLLWVGRFFGINLPSGVYRLEFVVDKKVVGRHVLEIREA